MFYTSLLFKVELHISSLFGYAKFQYQHKIKLEHVRLQIYDRLYMNDFVLVHLELYICLYVAPPYMPICPISDNNPTPKVWEQGRFGDLWE